MGAYIEVAHRGGANLGNENTLSCLTAGLSVGCDMVEIDVHLTKDGELVVCHDPSIDRTTDGTGKIEDLTLAEIRSFHIKDSKTGEVTEETIPTLKEVLDLVYCEGSILIEIKKKKNQYPGIEQKVVDAIRTRESERWTVVQSFNDSVLNEMHSIAPDIRLQKLTVLPFGYNKCDFVEAVNILVNFASKGFIKKVHDSGKMVGVWTINEPSQVEKLLNSEDPIDIVITNSPDKF